MITEVIIPGEAEARPAARVLPFPRTRVLAYGLLAFSMAGGLFLRLHGIGRYGYWTDELFHVLAAESYLTDGRLSVPTLGEYTRAKPVTYITAAAFKLLGESEAAARLPFALINVVFIGAGFFLLR